MMERVIPRYRSAGSLVDDRRNFSGLPRPVVREQQIFLGLGAPVPWGNIRGHEIENRYAAAVAIPDDHRPPAMIPTLAGFARRPPGRTMRSASACAAGWHNRRRGARNGCRSRRPTRNCPSGSNGNSRAPARPQTWRAAIASGSWVIAFEIGSTGNGRNPIFNGRRQPSCGGTSRMTRECQVRICERLGVKFPGPTRPNRRCHVIPNHGFFQVLRTGCAGGEYRLGDPAD
jgi:hypothetical protein